MITPVSTDLKKPAPGRSPDAGFSLVEVVIAIGIIGMAMFTVMMATSSGVVFQGMARQRQSAVGVANQVMERLRALPLSDLEAGLDNTGGALTSDPYVKSCNVSGSTVLRLFDCTATTKGAGATEPLKWYDCTKYPTGTCPSPSSPLGSTHAGAVPMNGIDYRWYAYLTQRSAALPLRFTVIVDWTWRGKPYSTQVQSLAWSPEGCVSGITHYVSAPCGSGSGGSARGRVLEVSISWTGGSGSWNAGQIEGTYLQEGSASPYSRYISGSVALPGGGVTKVAADNIPGGDSDAAAYVVDSPGMAPYPSGVIQPGAGVTLTYPYIKVAFEDQNGNAVSASAAAAVQETATQCKSVVAVPTAAATSFPFDLTAVPPCMGLKSQSNGAIVISYEKDSTTSYPLVRIADWKAAYQVFPDSVTGNPLTGFLVRQFGDVFLGAYGSVAGQYIGSITGLCDAVKAPLQTGGSQVGWTGSSWCSAAHAGSFTKMMAPKGNNTSCATALASDGTQVPCSATSANLGKGWFFESSAGLANSGGSLSSITFKYQVRQCSDSSGGAKCDKAVTYANLGGVISALSPEFTITVTFPALSVVPVGFPEW